MCSIDILMVFILTIKCFLLRLMKIWRKQYCRKITHPRQYVMLIFICNDRYTQKLYESYFSVLQCYSLVFWRYLSLHLLNDIPRLSKISLCRWQSTIILKGRRYYIMETNMLKNGKVYHGTKGHTSFFSCLHLINILLCKFHDTSVIMVCLDIPTQTSSGSHICRLGKIIAGNILFYS